MVPHFVIHKAVITDPRGGYPRNVTEKSLHVCIRETVLGVVSNFFDGVGETKKVMA